MTKRKCGKRQAVKFPESTDSASDVEDGKKIAEALDIYAFQMLGESTAPCKNNISKSKNDAANLDAEPNKQSTKKEVEVVVFQSRKRKTALSGASEITSKDNDITPLNKRIQRTKYTDGRLNSAEVFKKLQFDVSSLGMKAFSKDVQREQERQRAIKLGAKPAKRKYVNYKELMEKRKRLKTVEQTTSQNESVSIVPAKLKNPGQPKFWKEGNKSYNPQIGKFRDGVLKLSSRDVKSVTKRR